MGVITALLTFTAQAQVYPLITILCVPVVLLALRSLYRISPFHPLSQVSGPLLPRLSSLWLNYYAYIGLECTAVHRSHLHHGPIVVTGPHSVDLNDGEALNEIYVDRGGFLKPQFYRNFDMDGVSTIFSTTEPEHRAPRAKAVAACFSTASLRAGRAEIEGAVEGFVKRFQRERQAVLSTAAAQDCKALLNVKAICRGLAIDAVTAYLFGISYGGCQEDLQQPDAEQRALTANAMVDAFVAVGNRWYLPPWAFQRVEQVVAWLRPDATADSSIETVDRYVERVVKQAKQAGKDANSYPARLLAAGFSDAETHVQCKDLIFAGTDSTAMNLATICFYLCKHPPAYEKLREELLRETPTYEDLQTLPYLRGVVREGLRLAMANPSRLARVVPRGGWTFKGTYFPGGTVVSCTPFELHFDPVIYPDPHTFRPERWLAPPVQSASMNRNHIPFGLGSRQCIARNLASVELYCAVRKIAEEDLLRNLRPVSDRIEIKEWFNSHVKGDGIMLEVEA